MSAEAKGDTLVINGDTYVKVFSYKEAAEIPWGSAKVHTIAECSGQYRTSLKAEVTFPQYFSVSFLISSNYRSI